MGLVHAPAIGYINFNMRPMPLRCNSKRTFCVSAVKLNNDNINNDPLLLAATTCAFLRSQETLRPGKPHIISSFPSVTHFVKHFKDVGHHFSLVYIPCVLAVPIEFHIG